MFSIITMKTRLRFVFVSFVLSINQYIYYVLFFCKTCEVITTCNVNKYSNIFYVIYVLLKTSLKRFDKKKIQHFRGLVNIHCRNSSFKQYFAIDFSFKTLNVWLFGFGCCTGFELLQSNLISKFENFHFFNNFLHLIIYRFLKIIWF